MPGCTLFLSWPDLEDAAAAAPEVTASLIAHVSRRHLSTRFSRLNPYAWVGDNSVSGSPLYGRWGFSVRVGEPTLDDLLTLLHSAGSPEHLVLAMSEQRATPFAAAARSAGVECEVWTSGSRGTLADGTPVLPVWQALPLATAHPVGLYVCAAVLEQFAAMHVPSPSGAPGPGGFLHVADRLLSRAALLGSVTQARFYTGSPEEPVVDVAGLSRSAALARLESVAPTLAKGDASDRLHNDVQAELETGLSPRTLVVVSDELRVTELSSSARSRQRRLVLWPPVEEPIARSVRAEVDACTALGSVLDLLRRDGNAAPLPGVQAASQRDSARPARVANGRGPEPPLLSAPPAIAAATEAQEGTGLLTYVTKVAHLVECLRRERGEATIPESVVTEALAAHGDFGEENPLQWLREACAEGVLLRSRGTARTRSGATLLRPNPEHPAARAALEIPDRCLRLLHQMLQKMPWVSFKLLRTVLLRDQWLGSPPYRLDETGVDEWVNFLIQDGAIEMTKERNLVNPEYPVTALRLNPAHPLASAVILEAGGTARLAPQRAILAVDHFLTRNRKPWMSIGALRRALESLGRDELQAVLHQLQEEGALIIESYRNPQKEHPTTGCRLGTQTPLVRETLERRDAILLAVRECAGEPGGWTSLVKLDHALRTSSPGRMAPDKRLDWCQLLRSEGLLEFSPDLPVTEEIMSTIRCRLVPDPVTRQALARGEPGKPHGFECERREWSRPSPVEV